MDFSSKFCIIHGKCLLLHLLKCIIYEYNIVKGRNPKQDYPQGYK